MNIINKIKQKFRRRALYLVHYGFQDKYNPSHSGRGSGAYKICPKINSFSQLNWIIDQIKKGYDDPDNINIVIINIIRLN